MRDYCKRLLLLFTPLIVVVTCLHKGYCQVYDFSEHNFRLLRKDLAYCESILWETVVILGNTFKGKAASRYISF